MKKLLFLPLFILCSLHLFAQNLTPTQLKSFREDLALNTRNEPLATIAITRTCAVAVYGGNGYQENSIPLKLKVTLGAFNGFGLKIRDIHITESGKWCVVGDQVQYSDDIPTECKNSITALIKTERINCVSFDDYGNWVVLGTHTFYASPKVKEYMELGRDRYGHIHYVNVTNDAIIVSCETGEWSSVGWDVPLVKNLLKGLDEIDFNPKVIKLFPYGGYFIGNADISRWAAWF